MELDPLRERLRKKNIEFRKLEARHMHLEQELERLLRKRALTPREELRKKQIQVEKLHTKDRMEALVRDYRRTVEVVG
jgi:hypothetical protein